MEKFELFWNGPFSQWYSSEFTFEGIKFNRAEQFMMFCKALFFEDYDIAKAVMKSIDPSKQKALGRQVKNFNVDKWANVARDIVYVGNYCKFCQDDELLKVLLNTVGSTLVEASPYDKIWGIGLAEDNPLAHKRATWQGKNWLGETITKVREDILADVRDEDAFNLCEELIGKYKNETLHSCQK